MDAPPQDTPSPLRRLARFAGEALCETLWPTRCALCDRPGAVLCERCLKDLPYLDQWRACPRCGSPFGAIQCDWCNPVTLGRLGRQEPPFAACASATVFTAATGQLVRLYKDQGEQRLAPVLGALMARAVPPGWAVQAVTFVPATLAAVRHRGFDHGELLARSVARVLAVPCVAALERPRTKDQRRLTAAGRISNLEGRFRLRSDAPAFDRVAVVDDVLTTGSTLCGAAEVLVPAVAVQAYGLTFARA